MYKQIYNLKGCFECKRKKMYGKTADLWRIMCLLHWVFVDLGKFIEQITSIIMLSPEYRLSLLHVP